MIKLYGLKMSNYYSLTKALLIEKDLAFEEIKAPPSQSEDYLARSPMGKMPSIEVDGQFLSESIAIFNYLEQLSPGLLPSDPFAAAKPWNSLATSNSMLNLWQDGAYPRLCLISPLVMRQRARLSGTLPRELKRSNGSWYVTLMRGVAS